MAARQQLVPRTPEEVWRTLADPQLLGRALAGSAPVRAVRGQWPQNGSTLGYDTRSGPWTESVEVTVRHTDEPRGLDLELAGGRLGPARVSLALRSWGPHTLLVLDESPLDGGRGLARTAVVGAALRVRHRALLGRIAECARSAGDRDGEEGGPRSACVVPLRSYAPTRPV